MHETVIKRIPGKYPSRHWGSAYRELACVLGMSDDFSLPFEGQMMRAFNALDAGLAAVGSNRHGLMSVQVYLSDINSKAAFDEEWAGWIGNDPAHWPMRSCVQVTFAGTNKIEMIAWAICRHDV